MLKTTNAHLIKSCIEMQDYPKSTASEVVVLGRSNVGKSTFINKFCKRKKLAFTSSKPGKTQLLNFFYINECLTLVDVPGYGYAKVSKLQREQFGLMIETYLKERENLKFAILLVDFKVGPTQDDILMYNFLKYYKINVFVIATKKDKVKKALINKNMTSVMNKLELTLEDEFYAYSVDNEQDMINIYEIFNKILEG